MPQNFIKFYGNDWRSHLKLRSCSPVSRGVWIDLLTIMMEAEPIGHLLINGRQPSAQLIGDLTCTPAAVIRKSLAELREKGVFSETPDGVIYSRRMVRDAETAEQGRQWVALRRDRREKPGSPPSSPPTSPPSTQKPDTRSQKVEKNATSLASPSELETSTSAREAFSEQVEGDSEGSEARKWPASKWSNPEERDNYAIQEIVKFLPSPNTGLPWQIVMAAEDPTDPEHERCCRAVLRAAKEAQVGWVSPGRRQK